MNTKKSIISKIRELFSETEEKVNEAFVDVKTEDGRILRVSDMTIGSSIVEITEDGEVALEDGDYVTAEGYTISVEAGVITDIKEPEAEEAPAEEAVVEAEEDEKPEEVVEDEDKFIDAVLKDGTKIHIVTQVEGELTPGDIVHIVGEGEEMSPAPAGEHELEDGRILVVGEEGALVEVKEAPVEEVEASEQEEQEIKGVLNGLKELINQVKDLKNQFDEVKKENEQLKERFNKFASEPSEEPTNTKVSFSKVSKDEK